MRKRRSSLIFRPADELYARRSALMLTQSDLAFWIGCTPLTVHNWEKSDSIAVRWYRQLQALERNRPEHARVTNPRKRRPSKRLRLDHGFVN